MNYINTFREYLLFGKNKFIINAFHKNISNHVDIITFDMYKDDLEVLSSYYNKKINIIPHIWGGNLIKDKVDLSKPNINSKEFEFIICEPNVSLTKSCFIPIIVASKLCKNSNNKIHITCCTPIMIRRIKNMFHHLSHRFIFHKRIDLLNLIKEINKTRIPIVVSHQYNNCSNYLYYELIYSNVILVHNSKKIKEYGIYYNDTKSLDLSKKKIKMNRTSSKESILYNVSPLNERNGWDFLKSISYKTP